jgi:Icc-related predicted phosphoesterase
MKLLLVSDLHYALPQFDWVLAHAAGYDAVVLAGDHLSTTAAVPLAAQIAAVRATVRRLAAETRILICSGNHDLNALNAAGEKTADWLAALRDDNTAVDGDTVRLGDTVVTVLPWWDGPVARAETEDLLAGLDRGAGGRRLWVYHSPPPSRLSWTGARHYGDATVAEWIARWSPDLVLSGHIHQAPFTPDGSWIDRVGAAWVFNPGRQPGPVPTSIEIDLDAGIARWRSLLGVDCRGLVAGGPQ